MGGRTIVITGVSGYFGRVLLPYLEQAPEVDRVIGIDRRPPENNSAGDKVVRGLMWLMWRRGLSVFAPEWADLSRYPLVASNERLKGLGWVPRYTTAEALTALLAAGDK